VVAFDNIALFFAIGVGFGLSKDQRGEAALVAALGYLGLTKLLSEGYLASMFYDSVLTDATLGGESSLLYILKNNEVIYMLDIGVLGGMTIGVTTATLYNKYSGIKLPDSLAFFGGRRFVPMVTMAVVIPVGLIFATV
jgi:PTS system N-acetylglucosamine-specific IIC component